MKNMLYCIFDKVALEYGPVFEAKNQNVAVRKCQYEFKNVPKLDDFVLYEVGEIDHDIGVINAYEEPSEVMELSSLVDVPNEEKVNE